jgi:hypothetical protein
MECGADSNNAMSSRSSNKQLKKGSTRVFFYFDKTTEEVTIIQLVTILPIYKVQKI